MNVLIAVNDPNLDGMVAKRFGHAPYYLLVETDTMQVQPITNSEPHDETHAIIPRMVGLGVKVFITGNIGPTAFKMIRSLNAQVAQAYGMSAGHALAQLNKNELKFLDMPTIKQSLDHHAHS